MKWSLFFGKISVKENPNISAEITFNLILAVDYSDIKGALPCGNGAIFCSSEELSAISAKNFTVLIWII